MEFANAHSLFLFFLWKPSTTYDSYEFSGMMTHVSTTFAPGNNVNFKVSLVFESKIYAVLVCAG